MFRSTFRKSTRLIKDTTVRNVKPRAPRRFASSGSGSGGHGKSSDLPWAIPSLAITVPVCAYLWSTTPKLEEDHRWERYAKREEERRTAKEAAEKEEEEKSEDTEEGSEQATGEDNVEASEKTEAEGTEDGNEVDQAAAGSDPEKTNEPTPKDTKTIDSEGKSGAKKKPDTVEGDKKDKKKK